jgi:hypothetical protein
MIKRFNNVEYICQSFKTFFCSLLPWANTLAYLPKTSVTKKKGFTTFTSSVNLIKLLSWQLLPWANTVAYLIRATKKNCSTIFITGANTLKLFSKMLLLKELLTTFFVSSNISEYG